MKGTIQLVVNLRSRSVEYSREQGEDRFSCVLRSDCWIAEDFLKIDSLFEGESDDEKVIRSVKSLHEMARNVGNLSHFMIERRGNSCYIHPEDISFITVEATDDLAKIEE